ncbi:MAG: AAA family ATPase, partial [Chloroflexi bacterium]|nr:AAA family ATPase [Chloroflexota bacterium]
MNKQENNKLEFKQDATSSSYLKTVSAYANYDGGIIEFGRMDDGSIIGLDNPKQTCLSIENQINDTIQPVPHFELTINAATKVVRLHVKAGESKPYLYRNKAYKRTDTSTVAVDRVEFQRLILEGMNKNYEELPAAIQELHFTYLEQRLIEKLSIKSLNMDILKTLELYTDKNGFNHAAMLLSDDNRSPGIDIARMGDTIDIFHERRILKDISILEQYDQALEFIHTQ